MGANDAEIAHVGALLKHAHPALVAALRVAPDAVDPVGIETAGHVEEALSLQQRVLRAKEQTQGVLGALHWREPVAEVALVADRQDRACRAPRLRRRPP